MKWLYCFCFCFIAIALSALACKKDKHQENNVKVCGVTDPVKNIPWLKHAVDSFLQIKQQGDVKVVTYNGQDYVNIQADFLSCWACHLHTCDGRPLIYPADSTLLKELLGNGHLKTAVVAKFGY